MGLEEAVKKEMAADGVTVATTPNGQRFHLTRGECTAKFDLEGDTIIWVSIQSPGEGWLDDAVRFVKQVAPKHGVKQVLATAGSERSYKALTNRGFKDHEGKLRLKV